MIQEALILKITIKGKPKPLKRHFHRKDGRNFDPSYKDKKDIIFKTAQFKPKQPLKGGLRVYMTFYMPRPKSHFRTGKFKNQLRGNIALYHTTTPDIDNLIKLIFDSFNEIFWEDDKQICQLQSEKMYCDIGEKPRTEIIIEGAD